MTNPFHPTLDEVKRALPWGAWRLNGDHGPGRWAALKGEDNPSSFGANVEVVTCQQIHGHLNEPLGECREWHFGDTFLHPSALRPCPKCNGTGQIDQWKSLRALVEERVR